MPDNMRVDEGIHVESKNDDKISILNALLKESKESIQKASKLLEKYHKKKAEMGAASTDFAATQTDALELSKIENIDIDADDQLEILNSVSEDLNRCLKIDSGVQTVTDKNVQTNENFNWKSHHYFKGIYKTYSHLNYGDLDQQRSKPTCLRNLSPQEMKRDEDKGEN